MTAQNTGSNAFVALSNAMADAVARAGAWTVTVDARRRFPASGIVYASDLVLTADHVVEREDDLRVMLPGREPLRASLAGRDPGSDLALLRLDEHLPGVAEIVPSPARVGQLVLALGRPEAEGLQASLGVISALGGPVRTRRGGLLEQYLATDAIPYPGFSGGPLIDAEGRVLGLNTSGLTRGSSLAIPAALAWQTAASLAEHGTVRRGYLGVRSQPVELPGSASKALGREQKLGLLLVGIETNSPAEQAGLLVGDILVALDGEPLQEHDDLLGRLTGRLVGQDVQMDVLRGGQPHSVVVRVGEKSPGSHR